MNRKRPLLFAATAFALLFLVKILVSGLFLQGGAIPFPAAEALAEEETRKGAPPEGVRALTEKEKRLKEWEDELKERERQILPLQQEIDRKMAELEDIQADLTAFAKTLAEREAALNDAKAQHLVSLYQAMEPERAAAIMGKLDVPTVVRILANMKGKSAGLILAAMPPDRGAEISEQLSRTE